MAEVYVEYLTQDGDRWDIIAGKMYGDPWAFGVIVAANPHVPIRPVLRGGHRLLVPVRPRAKVADANVPPWKRAPA